MTNGKSPDLTNAWQTLRDELQIDAAGSHPGDDLLAAYEVGILPPDVEDAVARHTSVCVTCTGTLALLRRVRRETELEDGAGSSDTSNVVSLADAAAVRSRHREAADPPPADQPARSNPARVAPARQRFATRWLTAGGSIAAAAAILVALVMVQPQAPDSASTPPWSPPISPPDASAPDGGGDAIARRGSIATRSTDAGMEKHNTGVPKESAAWPLIAPRDAIGELDAFVWARVEGAIRYRLEISSRDGILLWQVDGVMENWVRPPRDVVEMLEREGGGVWSVRASLRDGREISSRRQDFRLP